MNNKQLKAQLAELENELADVKRKMAGYLMELGYARS